MEKREAEEKRYPYSIGYYNRDIEDIKNGTVIIRRSDGNNTMRLLSKNLINDGEFHHLTIVNRSCDNEKKETLSLFLDGKLECQTDGTIKGKTSNTSPVYVGWGNSPFIGTIGLLRMWKGALDATHIPLFINEYFGGAIKLKPYALSQTPYLVGNWRLNEGYGDYAFDDVYHNDGLLGNHNCLLSPEWIVYSQHYSNNMVSPPLSLYKALSTQIQNFTTESEVI